MNKTMLIIILLFVGMAVLDLIIELLNLHSWATTLPPEFNGYYDNERYGLAQKYLADKTVSGLVKEMTLIALIILFLILGGFNFVDHVARGILEGPVGRGLVFAGILFILLFVASLPFDIYDTFVIEEKYGFNRTSARTVCLDTVKILLLSGLFGAIVFSAIIWLFEKSGAFAWIYAWLALSFFQLLIMYVAPVLIMPLFNRFSPLADGKLKTEIEQLAGRENFQIQGIYTIDGSKRSSKANAALTGFGKFKRIMLYDTLLKQLGENEVVAVLAHEIGHYKYKHVIKFVIISLVVSAVVFYLFSRLANQPVLFRAFGVQNVSIYAALICFSILIIPIQRIGSVCSNWVSRSFEYAADRYAARTSDDPEAMISALKKISADGMANLRPHPVKVFFDYSHPPVLDRIGAIKEPEH
jgi:STE24 endopeptidase